MKGFRCCLVGCLVGSVSLVTSTVNAAKLDVQVEIGPKVQVSTKAGPESVRVNPVKIVKSVGHVLTRTTENLPTLGQLIDLIGNEISASPS